ncbi:D-aminoacyl-tRNA deacylase [Natrialbaceae archaeon AArc-T1-2]|uniref:D-aminoacyl-tRNA deacylase n=1 Tax=Natrialbaceae archaeon AArc-T1-2 TaxID=3053904 RepID=UPI00255AB6B9|nr:D-aminoacyl-tRNA deacylase [Natrialbaceae archaeon AArc-T1-2]WIV66148.1 D-aminoacyl-tRNA deacylase [Natrialbaceae archaeon AArc-T1-2]
MIAIVESRADSASEHICTLLRELVDWERRRDDTRPASDGGGTWYRTEGAELRSFDEIHLELERPAEAFDCEPELLVFASRHSGETGPLLTGHFTGNFGPAEYGGEDGTLARTCPNALARLLEAFDEYAPAGYDVGMECTHHGPTDVGVPSLFAELGSDQTQWDDPAGAEAVARAILDLRGVSPHREPFADSTAPTCRDDESIPRRQVVGFGGGHYVPRFERIVRETSWAVGHVAAEWALEAMGDPDESRDILEAAFERSRTDLAVVEGGRPVLEDVLEELGYRVVGETWLREVGDRSRSLVETVEGELGTVSDGVRFGRERTTPAAVVSLPDELVDAAEGIDPDRAWSAVADRTVAFETENGGSRVGGRAAVADADAREEVVEALADVLEDGYDAVSITDEAVVVRETAFDPALAREAGVPEGPKFGRLADGESVIVDGGEIDPEAVHVERTIRFPI